MALAAGAAVVLPTVGALSTIAYYAKHPQDEFGIYKQRRNSIAGDDSRREFVVDDDPSEFSSFSSAPSIFDAHMASRRMSQQGMSSSMTSSIQPDHKLLEDPELQVWRDRYKWGRKYGMNFAHNDK
ncbi:hypothetical protein EV175_001294 [Coemansia sp. RSA 1933]|nr:hypothetical protein EV175_001294 [Coemansia sp. RSA 1933]